MMNLSAAAFAERTLAASGDGPAPGAGRRLPARPRRRARRGRPAPSEWRARGVERLLGEHPISAAQAVLDEQRLIHCPEPAEGWGVLAI